MSDTSLLAHTKDEKTAVEPTPIRKPRPLPKIPERTSSKEVPSIPLSTAIEHTVGQGKLTAQQIFQIMNIHINQKEEDVYALKTEIPIDNNTVRLMPPKKLMTPVIEEDEESEEYMTLSRSHGSIRHMLSDTSTPSLKSGQTSPSLTDSPVQDTREILDDVSILNLGPVVPVPFSATQPEVTPDSLSFDVQNLSQMNEALMTPTLHPTKQEENPFVISPVPTMTSFSLTHDKASIKTFRRMATKTHDPQTQFTYAKYLIQLVSFYTNNNQTDNQAVSVASAETRDRLQEEAEYWIDKLSKSNHSEALYIKGHWHRFGKTTIGSQYKKVNHLKAFKCFQQSAKLGCIEAHYELAEYYVSQKEYKKAISSYTLAASKKHVLALYKMANILLRGLLSQEKDIHQGLMYLKEAADAGNTQDSARSSYDLACIYACDLESIDLERNTILSSLLSETQFPLAIEYFKKANNIGMSIAAFRLGKIYEHGQLGIQKDLCEAYRYYTRASEMKCHEAMIELSRMYKEGIPGYLNTHPVMAYKWCLYATEGGNETAEYMLG
ncbi:hypothetical protein BY458DRAFT_503885 [Sporodiniella umbellata]|nr:hypothetical protein BY458DRAFT_503885 [Sporodiniella umbellata]